MVFAVILSSLFAKLYRMPLYDTTLQCCEQRCILFLQWDVRPKECKGHSKRYSLSILTQFLHDLAEEAAVQVVGHDGGQLGGGQQMEVGGVEHGQVAAPVRPVQHGHQHHAVVFILGPWPAHEHGLHGVMLGQHPVGVTALAAHVPLDDGRLVDRLVVRLGHHAVHEAVVCGPVV